MISASHNAECFSQLLVVLSVISGSLND